MAAFNVSGVRHNANATIIYSEALILADRPKDERTDVILALIGLFDWSTVNCIFHPHTCASENANTVHSD
jgi:hypothetical protein